MRGTLLKKIFIDTVFFIIIDLTCFIMTNLLLGESGGLVGALLIIRLIALVIIFPIVESIAMLVDRFNKSQLLFYLICLLVHFLIPFGIAIMTEVSYWDVFTNIDLYRIIMLPNLIAIVIFLFIKSKITIAM